MPCSAAKVYAQRECDGRHLSTMSEDAQVTARMQALTHMMHILEQAGDLFIDVQKEAKYHQIQRRRATFMPCSTG